MTKQRRNLFIKAAISIGLIVFILAKIDIAKFASVFVSTDLTLFSLSLGILLVQQWLMIVTWGLLLRSKESEVPFHRVIYAHLVGNFFGTFMPSSIGIDIVRAISLSRYLRDSVNAVTSLFLTRAIAFIILFLMAMGFVVPMAKATGNQDVFLSLVIIFILFILTIIGVYHPKLNRFMEKILRRLHANSIADKVEQFHESLIELTFQGSLMWKVVLMTVAFQVLGILELYVLGLALDIPVELAYYFILIPVILVVTFIPISVAGFGVREVSFVILFTRVGATEAQALSLSLLMFLQVSILAVVGGILYWVKGLPGNPAAEAGDSLKQL